MVSELIYCSIFVCNRSGAIDERPLSDCLGSSHLLHCVLWDFLAIDAFSHAIDHFLGAIDHFQCSISFSRAIDCFPHAIDHFWGAIDHFFNEYMIFDAMGVFRHRSLLSFPLLLLRTAFLGLHATASFSFSFSSLFHFLRPPSSLFTVLLLLKLLLLSLHLSSSPPSSSSFPSSTFEDTFPEGT